MSATEIEIQRLSSMPADTIIFRCVHCECVNVTEEFDERWHEITTTKRLTEAWQCTTRGQDRQCDCHTRGGTLQSKRENVGEVPF